MEMQDLLFIVSLIFVWAEHEMNVGRMGEKSVGISHLLGGCPQTRLYLDV